MRLFGFVGLKFEPDFVFAVGVYGRRIAFVVGITIYVAIPLKREGFDHARVDGQRGGEILVVEHIALHVVIDEAPRYGGNFLERVWELLFFWGGIL